MVGSDPLGRLEAATPNLAAIFARRDDSSSASDRPKENDSSVPASHTLIADLFRDGLQRLLLSDAGVVLTPVVARFALLLIGSARVDLLDDVGPGC